MSEIGSEHQDASKEGSSRGIFDAIKERFRRKPPPFVELSELTSDPDLYLELDKLKTRGYARKIDRQTVSYPIIRMQNAGNNIMVPFIDWLTTATDIYEIRPSTDPDDESLLMSSSGGSLYMIGAPISPEEKDLDEGKEFVYTGKVKKVKLEGGEHGTMLDVFRIEIPQIKPNTLS